MSGSPRQTINSAFAQVVCINLDRRADRWLHIQAKLAAQGIVASRIPAIDGQGVSLPPGWSSTAGAYGCLLSHLQVVSEARQRGVSSVLIFEDDVSLAEDLQQRFATYMSQVPPDWDMLYFGALHMEDPIAISENLTRIRRAYSTYAYALNHTIFDAFIKLNSEAHTAVDTNNLQLQTEHKCYCFTPHLAWVEADYSDAQEVQRNHWYLKESLVIRGQSMNRLLARTSVIIAHRNVSRNALMTQNLLFLTRFYSERLSGVSLVIVEQDMEPTINPDLLPAGCQYFLQRHSGPLDRGLCFNAGMRISNPAHQFLIFSDSDILLEEWDLCGNLRMCERYDGSSGFRKLIELTPVDTLKLIDDRPMLMRWFEAEKYSSSVPQDLLSGYCVFNRSSIETVGGWQEQSEPLLSLKGNQPLRIFHAPNYALRLHHD